MPENIQKKIENEVIDILNISSGGRLVVSKSEKNKFGIDLRIQRRGNYKENPYDFRIVSFIDRPKDNIFVKDFGETELYTGKDFFLLFVYFDRIKQRINDYIWLIPSLQFEDMAEILLLEGSKKALRFQGSLNAEKKDKYSKFLVDRKDLGKLIFDAFDNKGKFTFKETIFQEKEEINQERLFEFIAEARRNTFASGSTPVSNPRLLSSIQLEFQKGDYFYRDIYFNGNKKFIGQEIVYQGSKPIWGMNYAGKQIEKLEINFLREALYRLADKCRFGKICEHEKREFRYQDNGQGNLENFLGQEQIFADGKNIYKLDYQGGLISDKL